MVTSSISSFAAARCSPSCSSLSGVTVSSMDTMPADTMSAVDSFAAAGTSASPCAAANSSAAAHPLIDRFLITSVSSAGDEPGMPGSSIRLAVAGVAARDLQRVQIGLNVDVLLDQAVV